MAAVQLDAMEKELLLKVKSGDKKAFEELISGHINHLYGYLFRMTGSHEDAEDILQEALCQAYISIHQFRADSLFSTWLYRIAINICCRALRQKRLSLFRHGLHLKEDRDGGEPRPDGIVVPDHGRSALDSMIENETRTKVRLAIGRLPKRLSEIVTLKDIEGFSYDDIAARLGIPRGTVMSRLHRARLKLVRILKEKGFKV